MAARNIHPFPARMAPELALEALDRVRPAALVLDPMCGSGTVLKHAIASGHEALGFDRDPLAILISGVSCRQLRSTAVIRAAERFVEDALAVSAVELPWIDADRETGDFVKYWFAPKQRQVLRKLAARLTSMRGPTSDVMRVALSRTIITKDRGASLGRDVSHSRPHRVRATNDYDVAEGFLKAVRNIAEAVDERRAGSARVRLGDARALPRRLTGQVDLIVTSPPYLNAIDYMRAHRMSLVWLGHQLRELREIRASTVGAERKATVTSGRPRVSGYLGLSSRQRGMLERYACDIEALTAQMSRVLKPSGELVVVVGDCTVGGVFVRNSSIVRRMAQRAGLELVERRSRPLPANSRYLPPPSAATSALSGRLRHEVVMRFRRPATRARPQGGRR